MRFAFCLVLLSPLLTSATNPERVDFDIDLIGSKIGCMTITKHIQEAGRELYVLETSSKAKVLWKQRENFTRYEATYQNDKLLSSKQQEWENGKLKRWTNITYDGTTYIVDSNKGKRTFTQVPLFSVIEVFFYDVSGVKTFFTKHKQNLTT